MSRPLSLSSRAEALQPSLTLAISARAKALQQEGRDICSLSAGEPDFDTPEFIVEASVEALRNGMTRYGPAAGDPTLRELIASKISKENGISTSAAEVLVTNGGKQAIYNLFQVLLNPGDEVLIPAPYWLSYPEMARLAGARPTLAPELPGPLRSPQARSQVARLAPLGGFGASLGQAWGRLSGAGFG